MAFTLKCNRKLHFRLLLKRNLRLDRGDWGRSCLLVCCGKERAQCSLMSNKGPIADIGGKNSDVRFSCWMSQQRTVGHRPRGRQVGSRLEQPVRIAPSLSAIDRFLAAA